MTTKRSASAAKHVSRASQKAVGKSQKQGRARKQKREAIVRMYRQGLGDCFLITLPRKPEPFHLLLDCGALKSRHYGDQEMKDVVNDIIRTTTRVKTSRGRKVTHARLDAVAVTHEHWDHISGFIQARDLYEKVAIENVWVAWTEEPNNELAQHLKNQFKKKKQAVEKALALISERQKENELMGLYQKAISGLFGFFGEFGVAAPGEAATSPRTTEAAWNYILG